MPLKTHHLLGDHTMSLNRRQTLATLAAAAAASGATVPWRAFAQATALPFDQPKFIYGFPPGSAGDIVCRRVAERVAGSA